MVDLFYWFDRSAKVKGKFKGYFEFCDQEYQGVLKHLSIRCLIKDFKDFRKSFLIRSQLCFFSVLHYLYSHISINFFREKSLQFVFYRLLLKVSRKRWPNVLCYQLKLERFPVFPNWFKWSWKFHGYSRYISWSTNKEHANEVSRLRRYFTKTMQGIPWCCPLLSHVCSWIQFKKISFGWSFNNTTTRTTTRTIEQ